MLWYLAHPVAPDDEHDYGENMADAGMWWRFLMRSGFTVCAPWFGLCHVLDDSVPEDRALGMKIDQSVMARCDGIIVTGHRISSGMRAEIDAMEAREGTVVTLLRRFDVLGMMALEDVRTKLLLAEAAPGPCRLNEDDLRGSNLLEEKYCRAVADTEAAEFQKTLDLMSSDKDSA